MAPSSRRACRAFRNAAIGTGGRRVGRTGALDKSQLEDSVVDTQNVAFRAVGANDDRRRFWWTVERIRLYRLVFGDTGNERRSEGLDRFHLGDRSPRNDVVEPFGDSRGIRIDHSAPGLACSVLSKERSRGIGGLWKRVANKSDAGGGS
jgi:hypothetical protein